MTHHLLAGPVLAQDRDVWLADCSCGAEFEHPDHVGVDTLIAEHLLHAGAAVQVAVTVLLPDGLDAVGSVAVVREAVNACGGSVAVVHAYVIEGGPS